MPRIGLSLRVGVIVAISLLSGWLLLIALAYWSYDLRPRFVGRPTPEQVAAIIDLLERSAVGQRQQVLSVLAAGGIELRLLSPAASFEPAVRAGPVRLAARQYRTALAGRPVVALSPVGPHPWFSRLLGASNTPLELRVTLKDGEVAAVVIEDVLPVTWAGLPIGFAAGAIGTLIGLMSLITLHRALRPLTRLAAVVDQLDPLAGTAEMPQIVARTPEIRSLVRAFQRLQRRLAEIMQARMTLIGGLQHDIRTFATRLRLRADMIADADERDRAISDIADMIALLDDAILASRASVRELAQELIELAPLLQTEIQDRRANGTMVVLDMDAESGGAMVLGDRLALRRVVANLVENAVTYGQSAQLTLRVDAGDAVLTVDDDGPGIPLAQRELVLEPFVRLETSRARHTGGAGLGLAVARTLVNAHGGGLGIADAPGGGGRVIVRLPLFRPG